MQCCRIVCYYSREKMLQHQTAQNGVHLFDDFFVRIEMKFHPAAVALAWLKPPDLW
jgi:hypothetical protein